MILNVEITSISAAHPWLRDERNAIPLDILIYKLVKSYVRASPLKRSALKVEDELQLHFYPRFFSFLRAGNN